MPTPQCFRQYQLCPSSEPFITRTNERGSRMANNKPNRTGRCSGKWTSKEQKTWGAPKDDPWCWLTSALICSPAWRAMGINTRRLIDFLLVEHINHARRENGKLMATYDQLQEFGLTRSEASKAVSEAEHLGLIKASRGGRYHGSNQPSIYRLTFYADHDGNPPTNDWKGKTEEGIAKWKKSRSDEKARTKERRRKTKHTPNSRTTVVRLSELPDGKPATSQKRKPQKTAILVSSP